MIKQTTTPETKLYSENGAAQWLGISRRTMQLLPIPRIEVILGERHKKRWIRYTEKDLREFQEKHRVTPHSFIKENTVNG